MAHLSKSRMTSITKKIAKAKMQQSNITTTTNPLPSVTTNPLPMTFETEECFMEFCAQEQEEVTDILTQLQHCDEDVLTKISAVPTTKQLREYLSLIPTFNISNEILQLQHNLDQHKRTSTVSNNAFYPGSTFTESEAVELLHHKFIEIKLDDSQAMELLRDLRTLFPDARLPERFNSYAGYKEGFAVLWMDCCPCGEFVYSGINDTHYRCPHCNTTRYTRCSRPDCQETLYCDHKIYRTPRDQLNYRPLSILFMELLSFELFHMAINYESYPTYIYQPQNELYVDISGAASATKATKEMKVRFERAMKYEIQQMSGNITPINLLLSISFDGAQVYKTKIADFAPLFITIENLPPSLRNSVGIGMFTASLFTKKMLSGSYDFILHDCLVQELQLLEKGIVMTVKGQAYFVQARVILHRYDTKALEKITRTKGTGGKLGCRKCRQMPG